MVDGAPELWVAEVVMTLEPNVGVVDGAPELWVAEIVMTLVLGGRLCVVIGCAVVVWIGVGLCCARVDWVGVGVGCAVVVCVGVGLCCTRVDWASVGVGCAVKVRVGVGLGPAGVVRVGVGLGRVNVGLDEESEMVDDEVGCELVGEVVGREVVGEMVVIGRELVEENEVAEEVEERPIVDGMKEVETTPDKGGGDAGPREAAVIARPAEAPVDMGLAATRKGGGREEEEN